MAAEGRKMKGGGDRESRARQWKDGGGSDTANSNGELHGGCFEAYLLHLGP